jgi:putative tryptophan/tyrosine transport system substrate-binding protein
MRRRQFITLVGGAATWSLAARAQQRDRMRLVGLLMGYADDDPAVQYYLAAFRVALAKKGWTEGGNLRIELRWGAGDADRTRTFAKELVGLRPDAIVGVTTTAVSALAHETSAIPIVFANVMIRSAMTLPQASRIQAVTSQASRLSMPRSAVNGWSS